LLRGPCTHIAVLQPALDRALIGGLGFIAWLVAAEPHGSGRAAPTPLAHGGPVAKQRRHDVDEIEPGGGAAPLRWAADYARSLPRPRLRAGRRKQRPRHLRPRRDRLAGPAIATRRRCAALRDRRSRAPRAQLESRRVRAG